MVTAIFKSENPAYQFVWEDPDWAAGAKQKGVRVKDMKKHFNRYVLLNPDFYMGPKERQTNKVLVAYSVESPEDGALPYQVDIRDVEHSPALHQIVGELIGNINDVAQSKIFNVTWARIWVDPVTGVIGARNNGSSQSTKEHPMHPGKTEIDVAFSQLMAGQNFGKENKEVGGIGKNGVGISMGNVISEWFTVRVCHLDHKNKKIHHYERTFRFFSEQLDKAKHTVEPYTPEMLKKNTRLYDLRAKHEYVEVEFLPCYEYFGYPAPGNDEGKPVFSEDEMGMFLDRVLLAIPNMKPSMKVEFNGEVMPTVTPESYARAFFHDQVDIKRLELHKAGDTGEMIAFTAAPDLEKNAERKVGGAVNGNRCHDGTHITTVQHRVGWLVSKFENQGVTKVPKVWREILSTKTNKDLESVTAPVSLKKKIEKGKGKGKKKGKGKGNGKAKEKKPKASAITKHDIINRMSIFVFIRMRAPSFQSQIKVKLMSQEDDWGFPCHVTAPQIDDMMKSVVLTRARDDSHAREKQKREQSTVVKDASASVHMKCLRDALLVGRFTAKWKKTHPGSKLKKEKPLVLIVVEGESATGPVKSGCDLNYHGILAMKGVPENAYRVDDVTSLIGNRTMTATEKIIKALRLQAGFEYTSRDQLAYPDGVLLMSDQDIDGGKINGLTIATIKKHFPSLFKVDPNYIKVFATPLYLLDPKNVTKNSKKMFEKRKMFFTQQELDDYVRENYDGDESKMSKDWNVRYLKGLGSSNPIDGTHYFRNIDSLVHEIFYNGKSADEVIEHFYGPDTTYREKVVMAKGEYGTLDYSLPSYKMDNYLETTLSSMSKEVTKRMLISPLDGLKTGMRIAMSAYIELCKRSSHLKTFEIAGNAVKLGYEHGDAALMSSIVALAKQGVRDYNLPLMAKNGITGDLSGTQPAAARYIEIIENEFILNRTYMEKLHKLLPERFHHGEKTAKEFIPFVVCLAVINGSGITDDIGHGVSGFVWPCDPLKIVDYTLYKIKKDCDNQKDEVVLPYGPTYEKPKAPWAPRFFDFQGKVEFAGRTKEEGAKAPVTAYNITAAFEWVQCSDTDILTENHTIRDLEYATGIRIRDIVPNMKVSKDVPAYLSNVLDKLVSSGERKAAELKEIKKNGWKGFKKILRSYTNLSQGDRVDIVVFFDYEFEEALTKHFKEGGDVEEVNEWIVDHFKLRITYRNDRLYTVDEHGDVVWMARHELIFNIWYVRMRDLYRQLKEARVEQLDKDYLIARNSARFVRAIRGDPPPEHTFECERNDTKLDITEMTSDELDAKLDQLEYDRVEGTYSYLDKISIRSATSDLAEKLQAKADDKLRELYEVKLTYHSVEWINDLIAFRETYIDARKGRLNALYGTCFAYVPAKPKDKRSRKRQREEMEETAEFAMDDYSDDKPDAKRLDFIDLTDSD